MRCPERLAPGRCAAVHGGVNQYFLDSSTDTPVAIAPFT